MKNIILLIIIFQLILINKLLSQEIRYNDVSVEISKLNNDRENYYLSRNILYNADSLLTVGYDIALSDKEEKVSQYLTLLQNDFIKASGKDFPPSNFFYEGKHLIDSSMIYKILRKMPKGGLLHLHPTAGSSAEWVVKNISYMDNCYMYTSRDKAVTYGAMRFINPDSVRAGWESLKRLREENKISDDSIINMLTFDANDKGNKKIWTDFESIFRRIEFVQYEPAFRLFLRSIFDSLIADGSQYMELRTGFTGVYDIDGNRFSLDDFILIYKQIIDEVKINHPEFDAKIIMSDFRGATKERVMKNLISTYGLIKKFPGLVIGYDQVSEEDRWNKTSFYLDEFFTIDSITASNGDILPYYFHDGESTLPSNDNLIDAVLLGTKRIGHGINLFRFPMLELAVKEKQIALEVCPISNQILGYVSDLRMHPASGYIKRNIPLTINTDDPQIFNYNGLTYDFWTAFMAWELDLRTIKKLALNSLIYSGMSKEEKKNALNYFNKKWDEFIDEIIKVCNL